MPQQQQQQQRLQADLILAFNIFKGEVGLIPSNVFLRPPRAGLKGYTYRLLQGPSRCIFYACREMLEQVADVFSHVRLTVYL